MKETEFKIGKKYFIRTMTYHVIGELTEIYKKELVLTSAHFYVVEPFVNDVVVNRDVIIDATEWNHEIQNDVI